MILVTVGMQLGFDRLIKSMDELAPSLGVHVIAQTGKGAYQPQRMEAHKMIGPAEFEDLVKCCDIVVSHAGIGTVLTAQRYAKPIVLMPRRLILGEHRNDHQVATTQGLDGRPGILVAHDETELKQRIQQALALEWKHSDQSATAKTLHQAIERFIEGGAI